MTDKHNLDGVDLAKSAGLTDQDPRAEFDSIHGTTAYDRMGAYLAYHIRRGLGVQVVGKNAQMVFRHVFGVAGQFQYGVDETGNVVLQDGVSGRFLVVPTSELINVGYSFLREVEETPDDEVRAFAFHNTPERIFDEIAARGHVNEAIAAGWDACYDSLGFNESPGPHWATYEQAWKDAALFFGGQAQFAGQPLPAAPIPAAAEPINPPGFAPLGDADELNG